MIDTARLIEEGVYCCECGEFIGDGDNKPRKCDECEPEVIESDD